MDSIKNGESLIINRKIVSIVTASLIMLGTFIFIAGYFWGYRQASQDVQLNIKQTNFADQISYASNNLDASSNLINVADDNSNLVDNTTSHSAQIEQNNQGLINDLSDNLSENTNTENTNDLTNYYAELIGFGRLKAAQAFVDKMKDKGFLLVIRKRISKTGAGKIVNWYQVITESYSNKQELQKVVDVIRQTERLQGIKIKNS